VIEIWLNPACSRCRTAVSEVEAAGLGFTVRRYLEDPPTAAELEEVLDRLGLEPWDVARTQEPAARELGLRSLPRDAGHRADWIRHLVENPGLIQRPIVTASDGTTVVGRDPESLQRVIAAEAGADG
jgi:arsenate reductase